ncbi:MAG: glycosyltransferase family 4 protein [Lachnospiraceae bacterium]|nr:glycosyltransferase family 4 protein [Lachnospiraceae bacterium]
MKILHIAAHMGAGAGKAISGIALSDKVNEHNIILLDEPEKYDHIKRCEQNGISVKVCPTAEEERDAVSKADVVVVNWWHHPLTYRTLMNIANIPSRLVLWCHVNGLYYPELNPAFISCFDACMFTSKKSFENERWGTKEKNEICEKSTLVYGMGDFQPEKFPQKNDYQVKQEKMRVGYVGSLDYAKIHPDFTGWLKAVIEENKNICFELAGDVTSELRHDVMEQGLSDYVNFLGFREDVKELLTQWDAFIYLLNPCNFATTENALLEAMACGLPVVASGGDVERSIIDDGKDGMLAGDRESFAAQIDRLLKCYELRKTLGKKARVNIIRKYDVRENILRFDSVVRNTTNGYKKLHDFKKVLGDDPFDWFLSGCGAEDAKKIGYLSALDQSSADFEEVKSGVASLEGIFKGKAKASVSQYSKYFPEDRKLKNLTSIIKSNQEMSI